MPPAFYKNISMCVHSGYLDHLPRKNQLRFRLRCTVLQVYPVASLPGCYGLVMLFYIIIVVVRFSVTSPSLCFADKFVRPEIIGYQSLRWPATRTCRELAQEVAVAAAIKAEALAVNGRVLRKARKVHCLQAPR